MPRSCAELWLEHVYALKLPDWVEGPMKRVVLQHNQHIGTTLAAMELVLRRSEHVIRNATEEQGDAILQAKIQSLEIDLEEMTAGISELEDTIEKQKEQMLRGPTATETLTKALDLLQETAIALTFSPDIASQVDHAITLLRTLCPEEGS